jgi:hypothetical protein
MIDLDQMASILINLNDRMEMQESLIVDLQRSLSNFVQIDVLNHQIELVENNLSKEILRLDAVQLASTAKILNKK